jgi:hypothetical protein
MMESSDSPGCSARRLPALPEKAPSLLRTSLSSFGSPRESARYGDVVSVEDTLEYLVGGSRGASSLREPGRRVWQNCTDGISYQVRRRLCAPFARR